jgi:hypothetical protein
VWLPRQLEHNPIGAVPYPFDPSRRTTRAFLVRLLIKKNQAGYCTGMPESGGNTAISEPRMVTIFGDGQEMDQALAAIFARFGSRIHIVTTPTGWVQSSDLVVARLDTQAGDVAIRDLAEKDAESSRIICTCVEPGSAETAQRLAAVCAKCGERHHVTLLWHPPLAESFNDCRDEEQSVSEAGDGVRATELAEIIKQEASAFAGPAFDQHAVRIDNRPDRLADSP